MTRPIHVVSVSLLVGPLALTCTGDPRERLGRRPRRQGKGRTGRWLHMAFFPFPGSDLNDAYCPWFQKETMRRRNSSVIKHTPSLSRCPCEQMCWLRRAHSPSDSRHGAALLLVPTGVFCSRPCDVEGDIWTCQHSFSNGVTRGFELSARVNYHCPRRH